MIAEKFESYLEQTKKCSIFAHLLALFWAFDQVDVSKTAEENAFALEYSKARFDMILKYSIQYNLSFVYTYLL